MLVKDIAKICHEANRLYCESIGDNSQTSWDYAPEWQQQSAIMGVKFHIANPNASPSASHESWLKVKQDEGWIYGSIKNSEKKEHPCFVPFDELPYSQQAKDILFKNIIDATKMFLSE